MNRLIILAALLLLASTALAADGPKAGEVDPKTGKVIKYWVAPMDPAYIRNEPGQSPMGMDLVPVYQDEGGEKEPTSTIRIDPVTVQNMGVRTGHVRRAPLSKSIRALGTVTFDETRMYAVNTKFDGWIEKLYVDFVGETVTKGQPLFEIYSPELVSAQEEYRLALDQYTSLGDSSYPSVRDNAQRLLAAARKRLSYWDLSEGQIKRLEQGGAVRKTVTIFSPASGVVTAKNALVGHFVKAGMHQYDIADLSSVWVDVEIYEYELPYVRKGMPARMELSYLPGRNFSGKVLFVYPFLNPKTRTARLRLEFANPDSQLKPDMYANVFLEDQIDAAALIIPQEAVIDSGVRKVVFVALGKGRFEPREIKVGAEGAEGGFQVLSGLMEGEEIVLSAQFMMDSESRLREAIQKMLDARASESATASSPSADDLEMDGLTMDELNMDDLDMGDMPATGTPAQ
ncbi:efflux RND transporter periplasmic adaptor subunit [Desulfovibrio ferrophilus]|uniref:Efflux transporter, RND family, MFP subunit n=1 Tax=Desulfovibrio ferrophilus TaxID=241368 RepID=A0A2Z6B377_9BACT|nr:efflux RND transporter periplasmic adaptor subunit [Desulfovibrio ferrophilus]BBD09952.1 efflux transporter, RND family, MFP subunit [Desulfovibrio ferrophilus]